MKFKREEDEGEPENFKDWWHFQDDHGYYAMGTKSKAFYQKGDQLFNCYGRRTNRFLLLNYGFCLRQNKYNSLGFKVFVNFKKQNNEEKKEEDNDKSHYQKIIKLKHDRLSEELLEYLRANLIFTYKGANKERILVSVPVDLDFELFIVATAQNLVNQMLGSKYATTLLQDYQLLAQHNALGFRKMMAMIHRINQKEILTD
mmetsp:Transcript_16030/g.15450  ORF Transcript_16030/g.15450 Transcript_16030/m.15450 type:complete len:201 (+) Transcript_16030:607-1209(+)